MRVFDLHPWNVSAKKAVAMQRELAARLEFPPLERPPVYVAGADVSFSKKDPRIYAAVVVLKLPELEAVEIATAVDMASFPYVPGLLSFREIPILIQAFKKLKQTPDIVLCDGQGIAHPRGIGLASHLGLFLGLPTVGCAKSRLIGEYRPVGEAKGSQSSLKHKGETIGTVLRTRAQVKPLFISPGHLIDLKGSVAIVKRCTGRVRLPEPTRQAHIAVNRLRKDVQDRD